MKEETTILGTIWDWLVIIFDFFYSYLSIIPFTNTPWLNFVISIFLIFIILRIISNYIDKKEAKARRDREMARWDSLSEEEKYVELHADNIRDIQNNRKPDCCAKCMGVLFLDNREVLHRFEALKEVEETTANGKIKTRNIKVSKVTENVTYACSSCDYKVTAEATRELT